MPTLTQQIEKILDRRLGRDIYTGRGHIDLVDSRIENLLKIRSVLEDYQTQRKNILSKIDDHTGEYYAMSLENPEFRESLDAASADECITAIDQALDELNLLHRRFGRDTINISVIGRARQGKSRLLQSISGLRDEVIPASNGGDCTGAKSVICNQKDLKEARATVEFYTEYEIIEQIQRYLDELKIPVKLGSVNEIPRLKRDIEDFERDLAKHTGREQSLFGHLKKFVIHFDAYRNYLGKTETVTEDHIRDYVAQYDSEMRPTYKFLAVKEVRIFTEFNYSDAGKIVLVDTIGLGDTSLGIRDKMLATLRNDSDAAILVRLPSANGDSIRVEDDELYDTIASAMGMDMLGKWLFFALNVGDGLGNKNSGNAMESAIKSRQLNFADIRKVDCADKVDVQDNLLIPLLQYLISNLEEVDNNLLSTANKALETAYMRYFDLCNRAGSVLNGGFKSALSSGGLFDELFEDKLGLVRELNAVNQRYSNENQESDEIRAEVQRVIRDMGRHCPSVEEIYNKLTEGGPSSHVDTAYNYYADNLRASMRDALDRVNSTVITKLQDGVKIEIIEALRSDKGGRMSHIPLMGEAVDDPFVWLRTLIEQKCEEFPLVKEALMDILDYRLNIEGLLEYKANMALRYFDQESSLFTRLPASVYSLPNEEKAEVILQTLMSSIPDVAQGLMEGIKELLQIPVNSFNARIRKLRERLIFKHEGYRELKNFYREYAPAIWNEEFGNVAKKQVALKGWTEQLETLRNANRKDMFVIQLKNA